MITVIRCVVPSIHRFGIDSPLRTRPMLEAKLRVLVETQEAYAIGFLKVLDKSLLLVET